MELTIQQVMTYMCGRSTTSTQQLKSTRVLSLDINISLLQLQYSITRYYTTSNHFMESTHIVAGIVNDINF